MSSMIESYVDMMQQRQAQNSNYAQDAWRTHVKAYRPKGKLVESDSFSLKSMLKKDAQSLKYFANGIQGKGNDYSLGRINDLAIKLGGLGIAAMLATSTGSPLKKGMEFIGLGAWLAAMKLWPKLAINAPIKHFKGVDLDLEYESSNGRRKKFYADPQFICWDMMTDEQINEMGDKLGVPKNIYNRRKAVENKARQVAIQGNALTSATAGFATPLIAALAADQIGKKIYAPLLDKIRNANHQTLKEEMMYSSAGLIEDAHSMSVIDNNVKDIMSPEAKNSIKNFFAQKTDDIAVKKVLNQTIDDIFSNGNIQKGTIYLDDQLPVMLAKKVAPNYPSEQIVKLFNVLSVEFGNSLDETNFNEYISKVGQIIKDNRLMSNSKKIDKLLDELATSLKSKEVYKLNSVAQTKEQLSNLAKLVDTYNVRIYQDLNKFLKRTIIGDSSSNAHIWEKASNDILKAFGFDKETIKALANSTSLEQNNKILSDNLENIIQNPDKLKATMTKLGKVVGKLEQDNSKAVEFTLKYLDKLQTTLNAYEKTGEFASISEQINKIIANQRKEILGKYMSTNNTLFAPIKALSTLSQNNNAVDREVLKQLIFNSQNAENFINKLDNYKNVIKTTDDYNKYIDIIFKELPSQTRELLPDTLSKSIDKNSRIMKTMLCSLSDDVNVKFPILEGEEVLKNLKDTKFAKYIDEYFNIYFNNASDLARKIADKATADPTKLDELRGFLKLSADDLVAIKSGDTNSIWKALLGSQKGGPGYLENGRHRFKNILQFLEVKNIEDLGGIYLKNAKISKVSSLEGKSLGAFVKDSAKKSFVYNGWLKKIGLSFLALCGITALAISRFGKKNEFNPDIYRERSVI